jgi:CheY-like chemotaxis protein
VLDAALPKMFGFQVCELMKRNESLRSIRVLLVGSHHHPERYRRPPSDLYGADAYLEDATLPDAALDTLRRMGLPIAPERPSAAPRSSVVARPPAARHEGGAATAARPVGASPAARPASAAPGGAPAPRAATASPATARAPSPASAAPQGASPAQASPARPAAAAREAARETPRSSPAPDPALADAVAKAERLARIIVSDIVLYNEARFAEAVRARNVGEAFAAELAEGEALLRERVEARVREQRDFLRDELLRVARSRGME